MKESFSSSLSPLWPQGSNFLWFCTPTITTSAPASTLHKKSVWELVVDWWRWLHADALAMLIICCAAEIYDFILKQAPWFPSWENCRKLRVYPCFCYVLQIMTASSKLITSLTLKEYSWQKKHYSETFSVLSALWSIFNITHSCLLRSLQTCHIGLALSQKTEAHPFLSS